MAELSLRVSRLKGNIDDDRIPNPNETSTAYVVATTSKGCFVRLSRSVEGRVILKELSDDFVPNPATMFPMGRLVVGKVKNVKESQNAKKGGKLVTMVDMDLRESVLLASGDRVTMDDIQENSKYTGVITRVESYGVFVRIDNSDVSGLAHVSECSDKYIKNIFDLYNPGDFVKLIVLKMDKEQKRLAFSLKASNFVDDDDSDNDSASSSGSESSSDEMDEDSDGEEENFIDSEDEDFASKLAKKMEADEEGMDIDEGTDADDSSGEDSSDSESSDDEDDDLEEGPEAKSESLDTMDTNVGFDWGVSTSKPTKSSKFSANSSVDEESSNSSEFEKDGDAEIGDKSSHKARKKAAAKRREEEETSRRETALADGTADETPENSADFERLVASSPNSSEVWIKYMAFHLSLADIDSARNVANRAFERIEFRQEGEKVSGPLELHRSLLLCIVECV
jgi:rRNA biogenesis protein RRP5